MLKLPKPLSILVVEDDDDNRDLMRFILEAAGAQVLTASDLQGALVQLVQCSPSLMISDIHLPDGDGYTLIQHWRSYEREQGLSLMPAIAISGSHQDELESQVVGREFQACLSKPFVPDQLIQAIIAVLPSEL